MEVRVATHPDDLALADLAALACHVESVVAEAVGVLALGHGGPLGVGDGRGRYVLDAGSVGAFAGASVVTIACSTFPEFASVARRAGVNRIGMHDADLRLPGLAHADVVTLERLGRYVCAIASAVATAESVAVAEDRVYHAQREAFDLPGEHELFMVAAFVEQLRDALHVEIRV